MKNLVKSLTLLSVVSFLTACSNDKPASNQLAASTTTPETTVTTNADGAATAQASLAAPAASATPTTTPAVPTENSATVEPNKGQVTPPIAGNGKTTNVKFDEMSYDWGKIKEGDKMTHIFKFKNTGSNDLIISDARGSCGCTVPEWPKEPIKPGKGGELKVVFDSAHKSGQQSKTVTVTANTEPANVVLMIKGMVDPAATEEKKAN